MKISKLVLLLSFLSAFASKAQGTTIFNDPREVVRHQLFYLQKEQYLPEKSAEALQNKKVKDENLERLSIQLKQIYDGLGIFIILDNISDDPNYTDSSDGEHKFFIHKELPDLFVIRQGDSWVYSYHSIQSINRLHAEVYPGGLNRLVNAVPSSWKTELFGLEVGQYIGIFLIFLLAFVFHKLLVLLFRRAIRTLLNRVSRSYIDGELLAKVAKPLSRFWMVQFVAILVPSLLLPIVVSKYVIMGLHAIAPLFGTLVFYHLVSLLSQFFKDKAEKTAGTLDDQLVPLITKIVHIIVVIIGIAYMLFGLGIDMRPYFLGVSFGGIALALAAQDTVKNLFGSAMIFLDRPFQIGDWINYDGVDGVVEEVGFRSTRVRTFYNSIVSIPNGKLADNKVDNYGLRVYRRYSTVITITYDTPPELIESFIQGLREMVAAHPDTRKDYYEVQLNDLGSTSLDILFYIFFETPDWSAEIKARHEIVLGILSLANALGVRFAFPTQTVHIEDFPGQQSLTPDYKQSKVNFDSTMKDFVTQWKKGLNN